MVEIVEQFIPMQLQRGNTLVAWGNRGRFNYTSYRNKWYKRLQYYFSYRGDERPEIRRKVEVIRIMAPRQCKFDEENLHLSIKPIYDWLKKMHWIRDDSPKWVKRIYDEMKLKDVQNNFPQLEPGIVIRVWLGECNE